MDIYNIKITDHTWRRSWYAKQALLIALRNHDDATIKDTLKDPNLQYGHA